MKIRIIEDIQNHAGSFYIAENEGNYFWTITDEITDYQRNINNMEDWSQITKELYDSILKFNLLFLDENGEWNGLTEKDIVKQEKENNELDK